MTEKYPILETKSEIQEFANKNIRKNDFYKLCHDNKDLLNFLQIRLIDFVDELYPLQRDINDEYQKKLMSECKYFNQSLSSDGSTEEVLDILDKELNHQ